MTFEGSTEAGASRWSGPISLTRRWAARSVTLADCAGAAALAGFAVRRRVGQP